MSGTRRVGYDWESHKPKMIALYRARYSFPSIHKKIQAPGFQPSEKAVYDYLTKEGYPAKRAERAALCKLYDSQGGWPSGLQVAHGITNQQFPSDTQIVPGAAQLAHLGKDASVSLQRVNHDAHPGKRMCHGDPNLPIPTSMPVQMGMNSVHGETRDVSNTYIKGPHNNTALLSGIVQGPNNGIEHHSERIDRLSSVMQCSGEILDEPFQDPDKSQQPLSRQVEETTFPPMHSRTSGHLTLGARLVDFKQSISNPFNTPELTDAPSPFSPHPFPTTPGAFGSTTTVINSEARSMDRPKPQARGPKAFNADRNSSSTFDSGYNSGRSSPFVQVLKRQPFRPAPKKPFAGLHRASSQTGDLHRGAVQTCNQHEPQPYYEFFSPQPFNRYREVPTCHHCGYSAIHNLSWSAQYHKLEVFKSELLLDSKYDLVAIDSVGNCALHYAAAGGAKIEYICALIRAGIDPRRINTAGESFLHCLTPCFKQKEHDFETKIFPTFKITLINLLNDLSRRCSGFFKWRDNGGRRALDAFVSRITEYDIKSQITQTLSDAGYAVVMEGIQQSSQVCLQSLLNFNLKESFNFNTIKQQLAMQVAHYASNDPSYIHPTTGDNILHALARFRLPDPAIHATSIRHFASLDVDLNRRNEDYDVPLSVLTKEPPIQEAAEEETGATISKYIDAILWVDPQKRVPSQANVNMRDREGLTPLYYSAMNARPDSVRSLIEAGANVNARLRVDGISTSILHCAEKEKDKAERENQLVRWDRLKNVISYLEHAGAELDPTVFQERRIAENTVGIMPM
ncbi:hypothetical protein BGZ60DRAFT_438046 [Tricladium varicosporioides]|nr:hypothetical protein BGZ60DRAFT_438046 [Hymenoscyphus varicosporioides]